MRFVFLIGPPGSGKTVCGQELARQLGCPFFDTDRLIEQKQGLQISEIFARHGEYDFRRMETELVESLPAAHSGDGTVVFSTGGGLPIYNDNLARLQRLGHVIALSAPVDTLFARVKHNTERPLLATAGENVDEQLQGRLSELVKTRTPVYEQAGYKIDTSGLKPDQVAHEIIRMVFGQR